MLRPFGSFAGVWGRGMGLGGVGGVVMVVVKKEGWIDTSRGHSDRG
jgi:hypothetical protein